MSGVALDEARREARAIARRHDENFPAAFLLLPARLRADMRAIYAFCRTVDDLGDEPAHDRTGAWTTYAAGPPSAAERAGRLEALDAFERDLMRCWEGGVPADPRIAALAETVRRHDLEPEPFRRLVEANRIDQTVDRYETFGELVAYCHHSATPVGHLVLAVLGHRDPARRELSDHTCIGLQLVNFWQDIARDLRDRGRIYLPAEDLARFGVREADLHAPAADAAVRRLVAFEVARARAELIAGAPLARMVRRRARLDLRMFTAGGLALCDAIARQDYDTLARRPAPGRRGRARIAADVLLGTLRGGRR